MKVFILMLTSLALIFPVSLVSKPQEVEGVLEKFEAPHPYKGVKGAVWEKQIDEFRSSPLPGDTAIVKPVGENTDSAYGFVGDKMAYAGDPSGPGNIIGDMASTLAASSGGFAFTVTKPWSPWSGYKVGDGSEFRAGDFNGDGQTDLIHFVGDYINFWPGGSPNVTTWHPGYNVGTGFHFSIGKFNRDRLNDLIDITGSSLRTWFSQGNGRFTIKEWSPGYWVGWSYEFITGDFNGDGLTDLAHVQTGPDGRGKKGTWLARGDGSFIIKPWNCVGSARYYKAGDFNGDGKTDLVLLGNKSISTYFSRGDGSFALQKWTPPNNTVPNRFSLGNFNRDNKADLIYFDNSKVCVYMSQGGGTYFFKEFTPGSGYDVGDGTRFMTGDFNGDGLTDLIHFCDTYTHVWIAKGDGTFTVFDKWASAEDPNVGKGWTFKTGILKNISQDNKTDLIHFMGMHIRTWETH